MRRAQWVAVMMGVAVLGVASFPGSGQTAMVKLSLGQLVAGADTVVLGTVASQASAWDPQHAAIHTDVMVAVESVVKGVPLSQVTFRVAGGVVGDVGMRTSTDPVFQDGERVVVFLDTARVSAQVVGMRQGKFTVRDGKVTVDGRTMALAAFLDTIRRAGVKP
jgi:hypothetical protein